MLMRYISFYITLERRDRGGREREKGEGGRERGGEGGERREGERAKKREGGGGGKGQTREKRGKMVKDIMIGGRCNYES